MALILNSPTIIFGTLLWLQYKTASVFKSKTKQTDTSCPTTKTTTTNDYLTILLRIFWYMWIGFECAAEYVTVIVITLICTILKAVLQIAWLPVVGLLWWFNFYRNLINDPHGQRLLEIFICPESGYYRYVGPKRPMHSVKRWKDSNGIWHQQESLLRFFPLENNKKRRQPRPFRKMFPGIKRYAPLPMCCLLTNHWENRKNIEY